jgi:hypothetical protein
MKRPGVFFEQAGRLSGAAGGAEVKYTGRKIVLFRENRIFGITL